jgi:hypothetical protein
MLRERYVQIMLASARSTQDEPTRDWERRAFGSRSSAVARALIEAVLCDHHADGRLLAPDDALCARVVEGLDLSIGSVSRQARRAWLLGLWLVEWLPLFVIARPRRMSGLRLAQRLAYLERLEASPFGLFAALLGGLKVSICIHAFEYGKELASTGFDKPHLHGHRQLRVIAPAAQPNETEASRHE